MREVTVYETYDYKEFDNYEACLAYENNAYMLMRSIEKKYSFYDENMKKIIAPFDSPHVEDWLTWLDDAFSDCTYVRRIDNLTDDETEIIRENIGGCIYNEDFSCAVGLFKYNSRTWRWNKVDE